ncbi:MAG: DUF6359 domain-containing protein [Bacillaceae bacterium]
MSSVFNKRLMKVIVAFILALSMLAQYIVVASATSALSVGEAIAKYASGGRGTTIVEGYIVGYMKSATNVVKTGATDDFNIVIADKIDETDTTKMIPVQLTTSFRSTYGLKTNPSNVGKKVSVTASLEAYFTVAGLKTPTAITWATDTPATQVANVIASPTAGAVPMNTSVTLSTSTVDAKIYYTLDGTEPSTTSMPYTTPIVITKDITIKTKAVKDGLEDSATSTFNYTILQSSNVRIHDIQGVGHVSPYKDKNVENVQGIITKVVDANNFYMQDSEPDDNDLTAEGILVYKKTHGFVAGDLVSATGTVKEWILDGYTEKLTTDLAVTEINATSITKLSGNNPLPAPILLGEGGRVIPTEIIDNDNFGIFDPEQDGIDFFESLEGMRVEVKNPEIIAPQKYGELIVVVNNGERMKEKTIAGGLKITETNYNPERITLDIDDTSYVAKAGDMLNGSVIGVVSYGFSNFKVLTSRQELPTLVDGKTQRETTTLVKNDKSLSIVSYNLENFSANTANTPNSKVAEVAHSIVANLNAPDIIGLVEVQDNNGETNNGVTDASQTYNRLIEAIKAAGGPTYQFTDIAPVDNSDGGAPGGNIRVGYLYNENRVTLKTGKKGTSTEAVGYENGSLTLNPGRISPNDFAGTRKPLAAQFTFQGEDVIVIANHLNSKGGDQPLYGVNQPPVLGSESKRIAAAATINGFIKDVKQKNAEANIVVLGDMNDFEFSKPLKALAGQELTNMIMNLPDNDRFTYIYQGNSQVLDHILVSNNIAPKTNVDIVHLNAAFMENHGRVSDHDPVMVQVNFAKNDELKNITTIKNVTANRFTISKENRVYLFEPTAIFKDAVIVKAPTTLRGEGLSNLKVIIDLPNDSDVVDIQGMTIKELIIKKGTVKK